MALKLSNIQINEISLVKEGANGLHFIAKDAQGQPTAVLVNIRKADPVKKAVYGVVYEPGEVDTHGDTASAEEIQKAAWGAMQHHAIVKKDHAEQIAAFLAESFIVKANDPDKWKEGAWAVVVKIDDDALWEAIQKGEYKAFSMGGVAEKAPAEKAALDLSKLSPELAAVVKDIHADSMIYATNLADALKALQAIASAMGESVNKFTAAHSEGQAEMKKLVADELAKIGQAVQATQATINKVAEATTTGRVTSDTPGHAPAGDPSVY